MGSRRRKNITDNHKLCFKYQISFTQLNVSYLFEVYNVQILDHIFPLLFPKDSEALKLLDVGAKQCFNGTSKVNTHTHTHTDTHIWTT